MAGEIMAAEMQEQPTVASGLIGRRPEVFRELKRTVPDHFRGIALVARGSSENAAIYGRYLLETATSRPVSLIPPSLLTLYRVGTDYRGWVAIAVSQSGETAEIVAALARLRELGATGIAITNQRDSPLATTGQLVIDLGAGEERAVPATKTFLAELMAFAFVAEAISTRPFAPDWHAIPDAISQVLDDPAPAEAAAEMIGDSVGLISAGRGYMFPVAKEAALKLKETADLLAEGFSAEDFRHGPIAVVGRDLPVLSFSAPGPAEEDMRLLDQDLRRRGARLITVGPWEHSALRITAGLPEELTVFPAAVRAQQIALALARLRGLDPDNPEGLTKVTHSMLRDEA